MPDSHAWRGHAISDAPALLGQWTDVPVRRGEAVEGRRVRGDGGSMFTHETAVRFGDTDAMGHVNNATFLSYLEDARVGFFLAVSGSTLGLAGMILARTEIDFVRPILFGAGPVRTTTWVEQVGTKSFRMGYTMEQQGEVVARAVSVQVAYDYAAGASRPLTDDERAALAPHVRAA